MMKGELQLSLYKIKILWRFNYLKRNLLVILIGIMFVSLLAACGSTKDDSEQTSSNAAESDVDDNNEATNKDESTTEEKDKQTDITLPADFPSDFPFPDNITITEVRDNSEGDKKDFTIRFTFDPDMDLEAVFKMYDEYTDKIGYKSSVEGEEYFAEGIFQYAARQPSTLNMYVITMQPTGNTYGSIDFKFEK